MNSLSLEDLIALNDEIAALVRAGVPLEEGLTNLGSDLPGRLGNFATALGQRTVRGQSLAQAMADDGSQLPSAYRAVVEAGLRAGRLPAALEAVSAAARRQLETQQAATMAVIYPLAVVLVAWCGFLFFTCKVAPSLAAMFQSFDVPGQWFFAALAWMRRGVSLWGPILPLGLLLLAIAWWSARARTGAISERWSSRLLGWVPWMGRMLRCSRTATFLEVLALLVENETPLPEAVVLAARSSGDPATMRAAEQMATAIENGRSLDGAEAATLSPLVAWLVVAAGRDNALLPAIRHAATAYHRRARHQADMARLFLPALLTVVVGGSVTALYSLTLFVPYATMLRALAR